MSDPTKSGGPEGPTALHRSDTTEVSQTNRFTTGSEPPPLPRHTGRFRTVLDSTAKHLIAFGGVAVIFSILAIFLFLVSEVLPLFQRAVATPLAQITLSNDIPVAQPMHIGLDEHREVAYLMSPGGVHFVDLLAGRPLETDTHHALRQAHVTAMAYAGAGSNRYLLGTQEGQVIPIKVGVATEFTESGERSKRPYLTIEPPLAIADSAITALAYRSGDSGSGLLALVQGGALIYAHIEDEEITGIQSIPPPGPATVVTALALDTPLLNAYLGTEDGHIHHVNMETPNHPALVGTHAVPGNRAITNLAFLLGDRTLVVMTAGGGVSTWIQVRHAINPQEWVLRQIHTFATHPAPVTAFSPSKRDKGFLTGDQQGGVFVHYGTSARTLLRVPGKGPPVVALAMAPKSDGLLTYQGERSLNLYDLKNPHPEVTLPTLFGKIWYEGYNKPAYVWQSSSGSDDFEPKLSLTPLAFGTIKGTLYALLLAIPLAILAAIFTSQFMHPNLRGMIKPIIEIMAALPTVVLGFVAGLWLAPYLEEVFPASVGMLVVLPLTVLAASALWQLVPTPLRHSCRPGMEALILVPLLVAGIAACLWTNSAIEQWLFGGNFKQWLTTTFDVQYDQRNALVVGIVMGFAVIPIIYSISEEALSNVPRHLVAGSLALGATRWQTVTYLVILAASPGIFSAIMIGFGRAIGETMIVLMATGNTPIMDWSWFNGFRTLSANIAVEIPEAPHGGTLYRVLFLAALLLFLVTFAINTLAELVRQRLRKRYSHL